MPSLRHSSDREPGYTRRRQGRGWRYLDDAGRTVTDPRLKARFAALAIPPAWTRRVDLPVVAGPPPGDRHRRRRPDAVPLPPGLARAAPAREVRAHPALRRGPARPAARRPPPSCGARALDRDEGARRGRAAARPHPHPRRQRAVRRDRTGPTGSRPCARKHLDDRGRHADPRLRGQGRRRQPRRGHRRPPGARDRRDGRAARATRCFSYRDEARRGGRRALGRRQRLHQGADGGGLLGQGLPHLGRHGRGRGGPRRGRARSRARASASAPWRASAGSRRSCSATRPAVCRASYIDPRVIDHFLDGRTISSLVGEIEARMRASGHSAEELAVLALLRRGLEDRASTTNGRRRRG